MGTLKFEFKPFSEKQKQVLTWWMQESGVSSFDGIIADGAIRSGKTMCMSLSFVIWAMSCFRNQSFAMCGKTIGSFRRNVLFWLKIMLVSRGYSVEDRRADNMLEVRRGGALNYFYIFGGKDERSQDLIQGITLAGVFFDEVALMPESFVNQATGRCSVTGSRFWFNCNPDSPFHWFKVNWLDERDAKNLLHLRFAMDDNLSLAEEIKARYRGMYSGVFYDRYIKGEWAAADGLVYDMFDKSRNVVSGVDNLLEKYYVSVDYGTQNATVFLLWQKRSDNAWVCTREYYYSGRDKGRQKTDAEYGDDFMRFLNGVKPSAVVVDPSAASFIAELKKRGYGVKQAVNDVLDGIRLTGTLILRGKLLFDASCAYTIREFANYTWDTKASQNGIDKPLKVNDHAMDAVRYFTATILDERRKLTAYSKRGTGI